MIVVHLECSRVWETCCRPRGEDFRALLTHSGELLRCQTPGPDDSDCSGYRKSISFYGLEFVAVDGAKTQCDELGADVERRC